MTREEAITRLKNIDIREAVQEDYEAIDMAISALQDMPIHFGRCWDCVSFIAEGKKCKWDLLTGEDGYCHHFSEKYGELNCITESPNYVIEKNDEVIKSVRCKDCEWFDNCESFVTPPCTKQTEPSDLISRADAIKAFKEEDLFQYCNPNDVAQEIINDIPSADRPTEDYSDLPDIPRAYYEKIVGNMSHEINMLKQQLEDRPTHDCTDLVQWLLEATMDEEDWRESADANGQVICRKLKKLGVLDTKDGYYIRTPLAYDDRPSGEWIDMGSGQECSKCHEIQYGYDSERHYCPHCGAFMKGGAE